VGLHSPDGMSALLTYLRKHPWRRRALTGILAILVGAGAGLLVIRNLSGIPIARDYLLRRDLESDDPIRRSRAIPTALEWTLESRVSRWLLGDALDGAVLRNLESPHAGVRLRTIAQAVTAAGASERTAQRLEDGLQTAGDVQFASIVTVLRRMNRFDTPQRDPVQIDRMNAIELAGTRWPSDPNGAIGVRCALACEIILSGRDNPNVRRALATAADDEAPAVRRLAPVLAGRLADDQVLGRLLADKDAGVVASAALDAGLAGRAGLGDALARLLDGNDAEVISSAAYALALLKPKENSPRLCELLKAARSEDLRDRLLHVMTLLNDDNARAAVQGILASARNAGDSLPPMAILAAGKLGLASAEPHVRAVLTDATKEGTKLTEAHVLAALNAADRLNLRCRREVFELCRTRWSPRLLLAMTSAAELLGKQARVPQDNDPNCPSLEKCIELLQAAATYDKEPATRPAGEPLPILTMPVASAAAATALWKLKPSTSEYKEAGPTTRTGATLWELDVGSSAAYVELVASSDSELAGDYLALRLGFTGMPEAFDLGLAMLPPPVAANVPLDKQPPRVYNTSVRATGAMLLALSARTERQRELARERIRFRLNDVSVRMEGVLSRGTYNCALLILGQKELQAGVRDLLGPYEFPPRRTITALLASGDRSALDWLLWQGRISPDSLDFLLTVMGIADVLARAGPELPPVEVAAAQNVRLWQNRILRDYYAIHRQRIQPRLPW